jgi:hypothetical protein
MQQTEGGPPTEHSGGVNRRVLLPSEVTAVLRENYRFAQYQVVQYLAEHLTDCRSALGGDLDDMMIMAVLGQRALGAVFEKDGQVGLAGERAWMSALRISDVTGVPRETTRRRLAGLRDRGWIEQHGNKGWRIAGEAGRTRVSADLAELDRRSMERLGRLVAALLPLLTEGEAERPD